MSQNIQLAILQANCEQAVTLAAQLLAGAGLQVVRSFDLRSARMARAGGTCPHHGTAQCTCQFIVLLVYGPSGAPVTLVVHGHDRQARLSMVDTPQQPADMKLAARLAQVLAPASFVPAPHEQLVAVA